MARGPALINLGHDALGDTHVGPVIVPDQRAGRAHGTLSPSLVLVPRDERHGVVAHLMQLELVVAEGVGGPDPGVLGVAVAAIGRDGVRLDGDDHVFVFAAAGAARVCAHVAAGVDTGEGDVDGRGDEGVAVDDGRVRAVPGGRCWNGCAGRGAEAA